MLANVHGLAVRPNGANVYAASTTASAVTHFNLDGGGNLAFQGCIGHFAGCAATNPAGALNAAKSVVVSPDGSQVFATGDFGNAVSRFRLNASGDLGFADCVGDLGGCAATSPARALEGATGLTITRDGKQLFATGVSGNTVVQLQPGATGALSQTACIGNRAGCAGTGAHPTLNGANAVAVSPDGKQVYATASSALTDVTVGAVPVLVASGRLSQHRNAVALKVACHGAAGERASARSRSRQSGRSSRAAATACGR